MRVVFLEDVPGVALGGEVKEVKAGFARNYLIPKNLATPAAHNSLQRVERLRKRAGEVRLRELADLKALAELLDGVQINVEMRAGPGGRLYGSVTNAILAEELSNLTGRKIERRSVQLSEPIRELGLFDVDVPIHPEVEAKIKVLVYPTGTDPEAALPAAEAEDGDAEGDVAQSGAAETAEAEATELESASDRT
jgi:large subunit ribosomal protein L9